MDIGLYTFADIASHPISGQSISPEQRMKNLLEEIQLADQLGLDVFGIGEHHRPEYLVSSPATVLAPRQSSLKALSSPVRLRFSVPMILSGYTSNLLQLTCYPAAGQRSLRAGAPSSNLFRFLATTWMIIMNCFLRNSKCSSELTKQGT